MLLHHTGQQKARKRLFMLVLWTLLDCKKLADGAGTGIEPVRTFYGCDGF